MFGDRKPKSFTLSPYTEHEKENRANNGKLLRFVEAFRTDGHLVASLDPLSFVDLMERRQDISFDPLLYGLDEPSYDTTGILHPLAKSLPLLDIIRHLESVYCNKIAFEFMHIPDINIRRWFAEKAETLVPTFALSDNQKRRLYELVMGSQVFDTWMATNYPYLKQYSIEGEESVLVALHAVLEAAARGSIRDVVLCLTHRSRMQALIEIIGTSPAWLMRKFQGLSEFGEEIPAHFIGDLLYNAQVSVDLRFDQHDEGDDLSAPLHVSVPANPCHLELVNPVALGKVRAKQDDYACTDSLLEGQHITDTAMAVMLHGDGAFSGQGVVSETLGLSNVPHFTIGGSVHILLNNQAVVTAGSSDTRSTRYCSDIGKMANIPVIHVNADDPVMAVLAGRIAFEFRNTFGMDVIIDVVGYRRLGHNEAPAENPHFAQPLMYDRVNQHPRMPEVFAQEMLESGLISDYAEHTAWKQARESYLARQWKLAPTYEIEPNYLKGKWSGMVFPTVTDDSVLTGIRRETLELISEASIVVPKGFVVHPSIMSGTLVPRVAQVQSGVGISFVTAETLALGTLLSEGYNVRLSGQDIARGVCIPRYAVLACQKTGARYVPLSTMRGNLELVDSPLGESAVMAFEFGVSWENPNRLCIWEVQFGDFYNTAQSVIDTFLCACEERWARQSGLVMLLPHGFDGAGPEHTSCRIERFLQMAVDSFDPSVPSSQRARTNWHVVNCSTPAQYFHVLRRQMHRNYRKPLIVAGPKKLNRLAFSRIEEFLEQTSFLPVIQDGNQSEKQVQNTKKVLFVSGKLFYELLDERAKRNLVGLVALVRVEEFTPFPAHALAQQIARYEKATSFVWCQEEHQNGGAFAFMQPRINKLLPRGLSLEYAGRAPCAATATGFYKAHLAEMKKIWDDALALP